MSKDRSNKTKVTICNKIRSKIMETRKLCALVVYAENPCTIQEQYFNLT